MSECLVSRSPVVNQFIPDHSAVLCSLAPPRPALSVKTSGYRKIKSIDMEQLERDFQSTELSAAVKPMTANELEAHVNP